MQVLITTKNGKTIKFIIPNKFELWLYEVLESRGYDESRI